MGVLYMKNKLLVVVDMQRDFVTDALKNDAAKAIVPKIQEILESWDGEIVFTRDTHEDNYMDTLEGKKLPVPHCIKGTSGWQIVEDLQKYVPNPKAVEDEAQAEALGYDYLCDNGVMIIDKPVFGSAAIGALAKRRQYEEIVFVGTCTGICVISNAMIARAFAKETNIIVVENACACVTEETHNTALEAMKTCQIDVIHL